MAQCIYPGPHGVMSEEHYLPAALGKFEGCEPLRDRICRPCNTHIGSEVETQFLRAGPVAFFRWLVGVEGQDGPPPSPFYRRAAGAPPLVMVGRVADFPYDLLFEVDRGTEDVYPLRQIVFEHTLAGAHPIPILDRMRDHPEILRKHLSERGLEEAKPIRAFATPEEIPWVSDLIRAVCGQMSVEWVTTDFPPQRIRLVVTATVTEAYLRGVAKIAFHYTLKVFPDLTGLEPEFTPIKNFIWTRDESNSFVRQRPDQFVKNFRRGGRPNRWMHILAVVRSYEGIVAHAQFFAGPRSLPPPFEVSVGAEPSRITKPVERRAHQFVILDPVATSGFVGAMEDAQPAHLIWVP